MKVVEVTNPINSIYGEFSKTDFHECIKLVSPEYKKVVYLFLDGNILKGMTLDENGVVLMRRIKRAEILTTTGNFVLSLKQLHFIISTEYQKKYINFENAFTYECKGAFRSLFKEEFHSNPYKI